MVIRQQGILTAMADIIVADWGEERKLRIRESSLCAETLDSTRLPERDEWFREYFFNRIVILLASIVDGAYRLDTVLATPSPVGVSVVKYQILRLMLEYLYKLSDLVQVEIQAGEREKRAIEHWSTDYRQFMRSAPKHQAVEHAKYFTKWRPELSTWYTELTGFAKIHEPTVRQIFDRTGGPEDWWPTDLSGKAVNPAYQLGYSLFSALEHGNLWALQRYAMDNSNVINLDRPGFDGTDGLRLQANAGACLQCAYALVKQFLGWDIASIMNKLGSCLGLIQQLQADIETNDS